MRVMLVEDSPLTRQAVKGVLHKLGYQDVVEAQHGAEALEKLGAGPFDLLVTDWNMPVMSGIELVRKIRQVPDLARLPVIMSTSRNSKVDVIDAAKAGINTYIVKPYTPLQLKARIEQVLKGHLEGWVEQFLRGTYKPTMRAQRPFVVFGEYTAQVRHLGSPEHYSLLHYLRRATGVLERTNRQYPAMEIGYTLAESSHAVVRHLHLHRSQLKLLLLNGDPGGGGVTLARLARLNAQGDVSVALVCASLAKLPKLVRTELQRIGVLLFEREGLSEEILEQLFKEHVVAKAHLLPQGPLPAEEIRQRLDTDIALTTNLPVLPQVYQRISGLARDRDSTIEEWTEAIRSDPLSSAIVIRYTRSPLYGFRAEVKDLGKAVALLGKETIKQIIAAAALRTSLAGIQEKNFNLADYWAHSTAVALIARILSFPMEEADWSAEQRKQVEDWGLSKEAILILRNLGLAHRVHLQAGEDPFAGGLMHDIGKIALALTYPGIFGTILEEMSLNTWKVSMGVAEEVATGCANHMHAGEILGRTWRLGEEVIRVIAHHHTPGPEDHFAQLICLADFIGQIAAPFPRHAAYPHAEAVRAQLGQGKLDLKPDKETAQAIGAFLPQGLLETLAIDLEELLSLSLALFPVIQKLVERLRTGSPASEKADKK